MKNSYSTHGKNIAHSSGPDMVKSTIVQNVFRTLTLWNSLSRYCHKWPDLKIRFSNSSYKHGTGKADEIFTEIWRDSFSPYEKSAKTPLESHEIPESGSRSFLMASYIWVQLMKKANYRKWTVEIKIKLQYNIINLFKIVCSLSEMVNSWWKRAPFDQIFFKTRLRLGFRPRPRWENLNPLDPLSHRWRLDPTRVGTFDCCPTWEKVDQKSLYKKVILWAIIARYSSFFVLARQIFCDSKCLNIGTRRWKGSPSLCSIDR